LAFIILHQFLTHELKEMDLQFLFDGFIKINFKFNFIIIFVDHETLEYLLN